MSPSSATGSFRVTMAIHFRGCRSLENGRVAKMNFRSILAVTLSSLTLIPKWLVTTLKAPVANSGSLGEEMLSYGISRRHFFLRFFRGGDDDRSLPQMSVGFHLETHPPQA